MYLQIDENVKNEYNTCACMHLACFELDMYPPRILYSRKVWLLLIRNILVFQYIAMWKFEHIQQTQFENWIVSEIFPYHEHCLNWTLSSDFARIVLRRATNNTTGPSLIFLNIEIASKWLLLFKDSSFNDSISSPWIHNREE